MKRESGFTTVWLVGAIVVLALAVGPAIYGLVLAFKASIILGIVLLIVQPTPTIIGWIAILGHPDVCRRIAEWAHLPF